MINIFLLYDISHSLGRRSYRGRLFPCQCAPRSYQTPHKAKDVTLADIDIIGGIGDSDTAAFAANSRGLDYFTEYWGVSFVTGFSSQTTVSLTFNVQSQELMAIGSQIPALQT